MSFSVGSLVRARGRDWVVLPDSSDELLLLRPLGGAESEVSGLLTSLEAVEPATFDLPSPEDLGDDRSAALLRDALRLGFRSSAGPFRCFGGLNFEPRPYQLVPLLMALRQETTRLLIADDVGTGKTASALLVAAELLAQGEVSRVAVLCPPHLATQWREEMVEKFHLDPVVVLSATAPRLERQCRMGESIFDHYDMTIVSTDFIKADRRRHEFLRAAPELVIVDEAHTCTPDGGTRGGRHQRYELLQGLASDPNRHLVLVTATPHAGKGEPWRALLATLSPQLASLPEDLSGEANRRHREAIARHVVQRTRGDLRRYLEATQFPEVQYATPEPTYQLSSEYRELFDAAFAYATETVRGPEPAHRLRWWSALALLRSIGSSPAAALATLESRAESASTSEEMADHPDLFDYSIDDDEEATGDDVPAGSLFESGGERARRHLRQLGELAQVCFGEADTKLAGLVTICRDLVTAGYRPIVFCRYIPTANYVAEELARRLEGVEVRAVTGEIPGPKRPEAVAELADHQRRLLVATDCLAEGINLQSLFDAVVHYDLLWNPSRMAQREGRVSRLNQPSPTVRVVTYYGSDNYIDQLVLEVLQRRHVTIRTETGVAVPVPGDPNALIEAFARRLLTGTGSLMATQLTFEGLDEEARQIAEWEQAAERERRSRTLFAQEGIKVDEVAAELVRVREAIGAGADVRRFLVDATTALGAHVVERDAAVQVDLREASTALRDALGVTTLRTRVEPPAAAGEVLLSRTHPVVAGLARYVLDTALDERSGGVARRAGVVRTNAVTTRTVLILARHRFHLFDGEAATRRQLLAEDCAVVAFAGEPAHPVWLAAPEVEDLLHARPSGNVAPEQAREVLREVIEGAEGWRAGLTEDAEHRAKELLADHRRVRQSSQRRVRGLAVEAQLPVDVIGLYVLLPGGGPTS